MNHVAGTSAGITAIQLDTKIRGLTPEMIQACYGVDRNEFVTV